MKRAPLAELEAGERKIDGASAHYLAHVLRLRAGSAFVAFDPSSRLEADAVVIRSAGDVLVVRIGATRDGNALSMSDVLWIQGFAKGDKCDAVVRDATELGATRFVVVDTQRSVVKLHGARALARAERWRRIAQEAARQCGRGEAPVVDGPRPWSEALALAPQASARFCLYEGARRLLAPDLFDALARRAPLAFVCGPEGGLEDAEVDAATANGWSVASLGELALRTETVAAAVLGAVRVWSGLFAHPVPSAG